MRELKALGYTEENIERSKTLQHPFLKIGSKKRPINLIPDYLLKVNNSYAWVLDAKAPNENIQTGDNVEQVYSYATHPEIRSNYLVIIVDHKSFIRTSSVNFVARSCQAYSFVGFPPKYPLILRFFALIYRFF